MWAPKRTKSGREIFHWTNMTKVREGDIIFSVYNRKIVSVNIAKSRCIDANKPITLDDVNLWEKEGRLVETVYNVLQNPVSIDDNIDGILELCPSKYSPFTKQGRGCQGYLFEIGDDLGNYLLKLVGEKNDIDYI